MAAKRDNAVRDLEPAREGAVGSPSSPEGRRRVSAGLQGQPVFRCAYDRPYDLCTKSQLLKLPKRLNVELIEEMAADFKLFEIWISHRSHGY
jgi:hypothetical protein